MKLGILGGGQLGVMLADAIVRMDAHALVYEPDPEAPAHTRLRDTIAASFNDVDALRAFCSQCDVITYEREDLPIDALRAAAPKAHFIPDLNVLELAQDRALEKAFLVENDLPCVRHLVVGSQSLEDACGAFGFPAILKTTRSGYDGKGQFVLHSMADAIEAQRAIPDAAWLLEEPVSLVAEASCLVARSASEETAFPVAENIHLEHILDRSIVPCRFRPEMELAIRELAIQTARRLDMHGILSVEFFIVATRADTSTPSSAVRVGNHEVFINEIAPRPHNSGHVFGRACTFGQFDALARILLGIPLGAPALVTQSPASTLNGSAFCMGNLLGEVWLAQQSDGKLDLSAWRSFPDVIDVHIYGKRTAAPRRKMGHFIVRETSADDAAARALEFRRALTLGRIDEVPPEGV